MIAYCYVKRGLHHEDAVCEDTVLMGNEIIKDGFAYVKLEDEFLVGISDGVGGAKAGEFASGNTMLTLAELIPSELSCLDVLEVVEETNSSIYQIGQALPQYEGMAATLTLLGNMNDGSMIVQLGNTRMYELTNWGMGDLLVQVTKDHNRLNDLKDKGLDISELEGSSKAFHLTSCIGMREDVFARRVDVNKEYSMSDTVRRILFTSDGIHDHMTNAELMECCSKRGNPEDILRGIIEKALDNGSTDDMSVILLINDESELVDFEE